MRTPGEDEELAAGFLAGRGADRRARRRRVGRARRRPGGERGGGAHRGGLRRDPAGERRFHLTSSCGVCGKAALEYVGIAAPPPTRPRPLIEPEVIAAAPEAAPRRAGRVRADRRGARHRRCSSRRADPRASARTSGATTRWTRRSGRSCSPGRWPPPGRVRLRERPRVVRAGAEGEPGRPGGYRGGGRAVDRWRSALARERGMVLCGFVARRVVQRLRRRGRGAISLRSGPGE